MYVVRINIRRVAASCVLNVIIAISEKEYILLLLLRIYNNKCIDARRRGANIIFNNNNIFYANIHIIYIMRWRCCRGAGLSRECYDLSPFLIFKSFRKRPGGQLKFRTDVVGRILYSYLYIWKLNETSAHTHNKKKWQQCQGVCTKRVGIHIIQYYIRDFKFSLVFFPNIMRFVTLLSRLLFKCQTLSSSNLKLVLYLLRSNLFQLLCMDPCKKKKNNK